MAGRSAAPAATGASRNASTALLTARPLAEQPVAHGAPHAADAVLPGDLLALGVRAAVVGDRLFVDAPAAARDLGRDLGLEAESILAQRDVAQHVGAEDLVAGP